MTIISTAAVKKCLTCEYWGGDSGCTRWIKWSILK